MEDEHEASAFIAHKTLTTLLILPDHSFQIVLETISALKY